MARPGASAARISVLGPHHPEAGGTGPAARAGGCEQLRLSRAPATAVRSSGRPLTFAPPAGAPGRNRAAPSHLCSARVLCRAPPRCRIREGPGHVCGGRWVSQRQVFEASNPREPCINRCHAWCVDWPAASAAAPRHASLARVSGESCGLLRRRVAGAGVRPGVPEPSRQRPLPAKGGAGLRRSPSMETIMAACEASDRIQGQQAAPHWTQLRRTGPPCTNAAPPPARTAGVAPHAAAGAHGAGTRGSAQRSRPH